LTKPRRALTTLPLVAATYFMVAGGPYGLEELVQKAGVSRAVLVLVLTPIVWSLPTSLMVAELGAAIPEEGGYYAWVKRALGPFWGFQEAWLSLAASVFDMAIYPTLFVTYLGRLWPGANAHPVALGAAMIAVCVGANLGGAKAAGRASEALTALLLLPFVIFVLVVIYKYVPSTPGAVASGPRDGGDLLGAVLVAMWNYMGWDNASTVADEVVRPQRTYPVAMLATVALVALTYVIPVVALGLAGVDVRAWDTGSWVEAGASVGGGWLGKLVVVGGMVCGVGMFNALLLSYSRIPAALADDGYLPAIFARRTKRTEAPWLALLVCAVAWTAMLGLSLERLIALDILLYGAALVLEFVALVVLRLREPKLDRPFKVPGGLPVAVALGVGPLALLVLALVRNEHEEIAGVSGIAIGAVVIAVGPLLYLALRGRARRFTELQRATAARAGSS
jgi:amino acid transporter